MFSGTQTFSCGSGSLPALPAAGHAGKGGSFYASVAVKIPVEVRGACAGPSKSVVAGLYPLDRFPTSQSQSGSWKHCHFLRREESAEYLSAAAIRLRYGPYSRLPLCTPRTGYDPYCRLFRRTPRTEHAQYCLPPSVWLHSWLLPLW